MRRIFLAATLIFAAVQVYAEIGAMKVPTAADGEVEVLVNAETHKPVGAQDGRARMTFAGLMMGPEPSATGTWWDWSYAIQFKGDQKVKSIVIDDEIGKELKTVLDDESPKVLSGVWHGHEPERLVTKDIVDAMSAPEAWVRLRRVTITYDDGTVSKLHQLVIERREDRVAMLTSLLKATSAMSAAASAAIPP